MCLGRLAHDGRGEFLAVGQWFSVLSSSSSENNVGNEAFFVIGLHGSGDKISLFLQDWEVAKVALSCHTALDMLCQELYEVERDVVGLASERACRLSDKSL